MNALAAIHVARKQLGLDDDTYRALALRVTGERSAGSMTEVQRGKFLDELHRLGFKPAEKGLQGPFAKKLQALWIDAWNLGIVHDRRDSAMLVFVKRQTNIDHTRFLIHADDAAKAVEALKGWMTRKAGVDWSTDADRPIWLRVPGAQVAIAQWQILVAAGLVPPSIMEFRKLVAELARPVDQMGERDWQLVMNALGARVRKVAR